MKERDLLDVIKRFAIKDEKRVIGISAGGIIMTPNINMGDLFEGLEIRGESPWFS